MEDSNPLPGILIIFILLILNAFFSSAKAAFHTISENSIRKKADDGDKRSITLIKVLETPDSYINAFELLLNFIGVLIGIVYSSQFLKHIETLILNNDHVKDFIFIQPVLYTLFTLLLVFMIALFGTILPKKFAIKHAEIVSYQIVGLIRIFICLLKPMNWLLDKAIHIILRILGVKPSELAESVTEEEIISMVNEGHEQGVFDAGEAEMITNIIELDEKEAQDIMTPKKKIVAVNAEMNIDEALSYMLSENYSRYPLYEENRDNIIGILHLKDVFNAYISEELRGKPLKEIAREPYFIPDTQNINILFHDMQSRNIHMAIAIDEYGQTAGLVAMEDILEEIVGNIQDEYDVEEKMIISIEEDYCIVKGSIQLEELEDKMDIILENEDYDTLNGLLISLLDRIPADGEKETVEFNGYQFDILETMNKMIEQVKISKLSDKQEEIEVLETI